MSPPSISSPLRSFVPLVRLPHGQDLPLPSYATEGSSGVDLFAALHEPTLALPPHTPTLVPTGIALALPSELEGQIRPRSGLALKHSVTCLNTPGTIDSDYRGEIMVILMNFGKKTFLIHRQDRIAQLVIAPVFRVYWREVPRLETTNRGDGGFGSSGT